MTIHRNIDGKELSFELSMEELYAAYFEMQGNLDVEDMVSYMEDFLENNKEFSEDEVMEHINEIASEYRSMVDNRDEWSRIAYTADEAFRRVLF